MLATIQGLGAGCLNGGLPGPFRLIIVSCRDQENESNRTKNLFGMPDVW